MIDSNRWGREGRRGRFFLRTLRVLRLLVVIAVSACGTRASEPPQQTERRVVWHPLGTFSGHGNRQTESFTSDTGTLRVTWETALGTDPGRTQVRPGSVPVFRLTAHSAISGRPLQQVVEHTGPGKGVGYVQQDPHVFYMVVEAGPVDWKFTVEEAIGYP